MAGNGKAAAGSIKRDWIAKRGAINADWASRHPDRAEQEAAMALERRQAKRDFGHKRHGTVETHAKAARQQEGALARLYWSGAVSADQLAWAEEILAEYRRVTADVEIPTASLETRVDCSARSEQRFFETLGAARRAIAYSRWRHELRSAAKVVLAIIVDDIGIVEAARRHQMGHRKARKMLIDALDLWGSITTQRGRGAQVSKADLNAAHGRLLSDRP